MVIRTFRYYPDRTVFRTQAVLTTKLRKPTRCQENLLGAMNHYVPREPFVPGTCLTIELA